MKRITKSILSVLFALAMLVSLTPVNAFATETPTAAAENAGGAVTYSGTYNAYMGIQTNTKLWIFRNAYDAKEYGLGTSEFTHGLCAVAGDKVTEYDGTFTDAVIDGDGTYTVSLKNPDFSTETTLSQLMVSTDLPISDGLKITNVIVKMNDSTLYTFPEAVLNPDEKDTIQILCQNIWNDDVKDLFPYTLPFTSCDITFTVSGMGYQSEKAVPTVAAVPTTAPAADTSADAASSDSSGSGLSTGAVIGIVAAVIVVIAIVIVALTRKKKI